jgi:hypothetical protein
MQLVRNYIADMAGVKRFAEIAVPKEAPIESKPEVAKFAALPGGMKIFIDIAKIMDVPLTVGADHLLAVVKVSEEAEGGISLSPAAIETFSALLEARKAVVQPVEMEKERAAPEEPKVKKEKPSPHVKILHTWEIPKDTVGEFNYVTEKKKDFSGREVELVGPSYEEGTPTEKEDWRQKMRDKEEMVNFLKTGLRYWYSKEWSGSEKRKTPA